MYIGKGTINRKESSRNNNGITAMVVTLTTPLIYMLIGESLNEPRDTESNFSILLERDKEGAVF